MSLMTKLWRVMKVQNEMKGLERETEFKLEYFLHVGDRAGISSILDGLGDINAFRFWQGTTPVLHVVVTGGSHETLSWLIDRYRLDTNVTCDRGETALFRCGIREDFAKFAEILLNAGADIHFVSLQDKITPVAHALRSDMGYVYWLLDHGARLADVLTESKKLTNAGYPLHPRDATKFASYVRREDRCRFAAGSLLAAHRHLTRDAARMLARAVWQTRRMKVWDFYFLFLLRCCCFSLPTSVLNLASSTWRHDVNSSCSVSSSSRKSLRGRSVSGSVGSLCGLQSMYSAAIV